MYLDLNQLGHVVVECSMENINSNLRQDKKELMQLDGFGKATVEKIMKFAGTGL